MSGGVYGGDEVGALVLDLGHHSFRVGCAGDELPKFDLPGSVGFIKGTVAAEGTIAAGASSVVKLEEDIDKVKSDAMDVDENRPPSKNSLDAREKGERRYLFDYPQLKAAKAGVEVAGVLGPGSAGTVVDWELFENYLSYIYKKKLATQPDYHPVLMSEMPNNPKVEREKLTELMFEKFKVPAFYLCKNAVLAAFANGRTTALVLDSGASHTSAVPVYDGYCLEQKVVKTDLGGNMLSQQCDAYLADMHVEIVPTYLIESKEAVAEGEPPRWKRRERGVEGLTKSYHELMVKEVIDDFKACALQLNDRPLENTDTIHPYNYEFPTGYNQDIVDERQQIPEGLFDTSSLKGLGEGASSALLSMPMVVQTSVNICDMDLRPQLYGNLVVTGGNSLIPGFVDRLSSELQAKCPPNCKLKTSAAPTTAERRFGSWIGGSILASLGSFQQMWISKQEYEETGRTIVEKKCP